MPQTTRNSHNRPFVGFIAATAALIASAAGCTGQKAAEGDAPYGTPAGQEAPRAAANPAASPSASADARPAGTPAAGGGEASAPMFGGNPTAPLTPTPELDAAIEKAQGGEDKKALAVAYAQRGTFRMNDDDAGARIKYRAALEDYRKALAADPSNAEAAKNKKMIEDIYESMGRPIPGEEGGAGATPPAK